MTDPVYAPWPPPSPRRFVWWEAVVGVVAPTLVALVAVFALASVNQALG